MFIIAGVQLMFALIWAPYDLSAGGMLWNWVWVGLGFLAAFLLAGKKPSLSNAGAGLVLTCAILNLLSCLLILIPLFIAGQSISAFLPSVFSAYMDVAVVIYAVYCIISNFCYFLVYGFARTAARRMAAANPDIPVQQPPEQPRQALLFCQRCGASNLAGSVFCSQCGGPMGASPEDNAL